uniref:AlNc14C6G880 protein n=1 Tax=Albugo laibachii Nc14 TaxID=890382 RepID=F0W1B1_9STRA|nr:AlNc14C6G880 [Albugo laibachii Nc14]|eukprot:CCA14838.1 AlNc14C6G880 [Albugo laibachii Nc14]
MPPIRHHKRKPDSVWLDTLQDKEVEGESDQDRNDYLLNRLRLGSASSRKYFVTKKPSRNDLGDPGPQAAGRNEDATTNKYDIRTLKMLEKFDCDYCANNPLLRYVLAVIKEKRKVVRKQLPKPNRASTHSLLSHTKANPRYKLEVVPQEAATPLKDVLHLIKMPPEEVPFGFSNVYWLKIVPEAVILAFRHASFFTLSPNGITEFRCSVNFAHSNQMNAQSRKDCIRAVDLTDLMTWINEKLAFDHIASMKSLDRIQLMIFYLSWKHNTLQQKHDRAKNYLSNRLFACDPYAHPLLDVIQDQCWKVVLFSMSVTHSFTMAI